MSIEIEAEGYNDYLVLKKECGRVAIYCYEFPHDSVDMWLTVSAARELADKLNQMCDELEEDNE